MMKRCAILITLLVSMLFHSGVIFSADKQKSEEAEQKETTPEAKKPEATTPDASAPAPVEEKAQNGAPAAASPTAAPTPELVLNAQTIPGRDKTQTCVACHATDGNSTVPNWPKIAGQYENYLVKQLKDFRMGEKGPRYEASMYAMVANLTDQDITDLAKFYSAQKQTMGKANAALVALGEKIYRGGNIKTGVAACSACHSPNGHGNEPALYPKLAGQHAVYIENQLRAFKEGKRKNSPNEMMEMISHNLSDEEMKAVSSYIEGLR